MLAPEQESSRRSPVLRLLLLPIAYIRAWRQLSLTREGTVFLVAGLAVALAALNTGNNLLYLVFATMLSLLALSGFLSEWSLRGISVTRRLDRAAFAGEPTQGRWLIRKRTGITAGLVIRVEELPGPYLELATPARAGVASIAPGQALEIPASWTFARRGRHRLPGVEVSTTWPFGIFRKSRRMLVPLDVVVFPARDLGEIGDRNAITDPRRGERESPRRGGDGSFIGLRELQPGDGLRQVHWRTSARLDRLVATEQARTLHLGRVDLRIVEPGQDRSDRQRAEELDVSIRTVTGALCEAIDRGWEVVIHLPGGQLPPIHDAIGRDRLLRRLAVLSLGTLGS